MSSLVRTVKTSLGVYWTESNQPMLGVICWLGLLCVLPAFSVQAHTWSWTVRLEGELFHVVSCILTKPLRPLYSLVTEEMTGFIPPVTGVYMVFKRFRLELTTPSKPWNR